MPVDAHSSLTSKEFAFANMPAAKISQTLVREEIRKNLLGKEMRVGGGRCCSARGWIFKVIRENDDSVYCTWCTFQGFSFSDKLYHWRNRLGVEIGRGITVCFFCAMTDTSGKVKDVSVIYCRLHWEWSCGHFPTGRDSHGQTWLSGLPPASLSSTNQPFPFF